MTLSTADTSRWRATGSTGRQRTRGAIPTRIWQPIGSAKPRAFDFRARHGVKGVIAGGTTPGGRAWFEEQLKGLTPLNRFPGLTDEQIRATAQGRKAREAGLPTIHDVDADGNWVCGPPDYVRDHIMSLLERLPGLRCVFIQTGSLGVPLSAMRADIKWFAQDIMPVIETAVSIA